MGATNISHLPYAILMAVITVTRKTINHTTIGKVKITYHLYFLQHETHFIYENDGLPNSYTQAVIDPPCL